MKTKYQYQSVSEQDMASYADALARFLKKGDAVLLYGDLGAGKTTFSRCLLRAMCGDAAMDVPSPTFTLVQEYKTLTDDVWHFDLYRLEHPDEMIEIGWEDALTQAISLIEWPDRLGYYMPDNRLDCRIDFAQNGDDLRQLTFMPHGDMIATMQKEWKL